MIDLKRWWLTQPHDDDDDRAQPQTVNRITSWPAPARSIPFDEDDAKLDILTNMTPREDQVAAMILRADRRARGIEPVEPPRTDAAARAILAVAKKAEGGRL